MTGDAGMVSSVLAIAIHAIDRTLTAGNSAVVTRLAHSHFAAVVAEQAAVL